MLFVKVIWEIMMEEGDEDAEERLQFWEENLKELSCRRGDLDDMGKTISHCDENYWLRIQRIHEVCVYQGWPECLRNENWRSLMTSLVIWTSCSKMLEEPGKVIDFEKIRTAAQERLGHRFSYVRLLKVLGY